MKFKWTVEFAVDESWVGDGFNLTKDHALDMLRTALNGLTYDYEIGARIISKPADKDIAHVQGFKTVREFKRGFSDASRKYEAEDRQSRVRNDGDGDPRIDGRT